MGQKKQKQKPKAKRGIIVAVVNNIIPIPRVRVTQSKKPRKRKPKVRTTRTAATHLHTSKQHLLLRLIHVTIKFSLLLQSSALGDFLLLALALDLLRNKVLVGLQTALDVDFELDDVVEHALELGV